MVPDARELPSADVLAAFGAQGEPVALEGGQGAVWRVGDVVIKALDMRLDALTWLDEVVRPRALSPGLETRWPLRLSLPLRSRSGDLVVDGWTAFPWLQGSHPVGRWDEIAAAGRRFSALLEGVERPAFLDARDDPWARADRIAWGEESAGSLADVPEIGALLAARRPVGGVSTLIHGDLTSNVLFDPVGPPAVLDLTPYWRPVPYGAAIVAVDGVEYQLAPLSLLASIDPSPDLPQYVVRALLFRMIAEVLLVGIDASLAAHRAAAEWVVETVGRA